MKGASDDPSKKTPPKIEYNTVNRDQRFELAPKDEEVWNIYNDTCINFLYQGFIQSFSIEQVEEFPKFYEKYGFVVIREVLSKEDISATIEEMYPRSMVHTFTYLFGVLFWKTTTSVVRISRHIPMLTGRKSNAWVYLVQWAL